MNYLKSVFINYNSDNAPAGVDEDFTLNLTNYRVSDFNVASVRVLSSYLRDNSNQIIYDFNGIARISFWSTASGGGDFYSFTRFVSNGDGLTNFSNAGSGDVGGQYATCSKDQGLELDLPSFSLFNFMRIQVVYVRPQGLAVLPVLHQFHYDIAVSFGNKVGL